MASETEGYPRAEEVLRLLAAAAGAARLYPPASALPAEAIALFVSRINDASFSAQGPLRYIVDPHEFRSGDTAIASGNSQVLALAEGLHALQVGQLLIAPGLSEAEAAAFVAVAISDPGSIRTQGGLRSALAANGVAHIAVIEVSLRATDEEGLLGVDLLVAPLDVIAEETAKAAERWAQSDGPGIDEVATAIDRLEEATRQVAVERMGSALMRLDEATRMRVLAFSLKADTNGRRMDGMLNIIANMKPAALARLLTLVAAQAGTDPARIAGALSLPPETARMLAIMLSAAPDAPGSSGAADTAHAAEMAREMAVADDGADIGRQIAISSPQLAAGRALATAVAVSRNHPDSDAIASIGDSLPHAARDGAFTTVREALRRLDELEREPELADAAAAAHATLTDAHVLADICAAVQTDSDAAIVGEILHSAGPVGAEALLNAYVRAGEPTRSLLRPVLRGMNESVLGVARARLRTDDSKSAIAILQTLSALGDRRAVPAISQALSHLDEQVRFTAITALADTPGTEATNALIKAIGHSEPETQRFAVREIGRVKATAAIHQLTRALEDLNVQRTYETKKEIVRTLERIATPEAERALRRTATKTFVWGRKSRELRTLARNAIENIQRSNANREGVDTP